MGLGGSRQAVNNINTLLGRRAGVLELVFRLLPPKDLKNIVLVCQLWREAGEPVLWSKGVLRVTRGNMTSVVEALDDSRRLQAVKNIRVEVVSKELLEAVARKQGLKSVNLHCCDLSAFEPELVARAVRGLEEVNMLGARLTQQQVEAVLAVSCTRGSRMETLNIGGTQSCHLFLCFSLGK